MVQAAIKKVQEISMNHKKVTVKTVERKVIPTQQ